MLSLLERNGLHTAISKKLSGSKSNQGHATRPKGCMGSSKSVSVSQNLELNFLGQKKKFASYSYRKTLFCQVR